MEKTEQNKFSTCKCCEAEFDPKQSLDFKYCTPCSIKHDKEKELIEKQAIEIKKIDKCIICKETKAGSLNASLCDDCYLKTQPKTKTKNLVVKLPFGHDAQFDNISKENWRSDLLYFENIGHSDAWAQHFFPKSSIAGWSIYHQKEEEKK